jgi:membrane fusion protein, multidrug efflux system
MTRMRARWLAVPLSALALCACRGEVPASAADRPKAAESQARTVRVVTAVEQKIGRTVSATGALAADDQVVLGTKVAGRLAEIFVDLGTRIRRGDTIAKLDQVDFRLRVEQADAALQQARARLGLALAGQDEKIDPEQTSIVRQARAVLDEARLTRDRSQRLLQQDLIARAQLDTAEANLGVAEGRYQDALEEVRNRQALLVQRRAELEQARQALTDTVLLSPVDGAVSVRQAAVGEFLNAGAPVATLVRTHPLRLRLSIPERDSVGVRAGQLVRLTIEGDPTVYSGRIVRLSPIVQEQNRTLLVEAEVPNERSLLKPGAFARAEIATEESQPVIRVPAASLVTFAGIEKVLVVRQGKIVETRVQTGRRAGDSIEIVSGLKPGEQVVLQPGNLAPGQSVTVTP